MRLMSAEMGSGSGRCHKNNIWAMGVCVQVPSFKHFDSTLQLLCHVEVFQTLYHCFSIRLHVTFLVAKPVRQVMITQKELSNKDHLIRGAAAMEVDFSKFGTLSGLKYGEALGEPVCARGFEKAFLTGQLIDFGNPARLVTDCIEQLSTRQIVCRRMISLFYTKKYPTAIVSGHKVPAGSQLPWLLDEVSKAESLVYSFKQHEEALLD